MFSNNGQLFITLAWVFKIKEMQIFARTIEIYKENWAFSDLLGRDYFKRALTYEQYRAILLCAKLIITTVCGQPDIFPFLELKKKTEILKNSLII